MPLPHRCSYAVTFRSAPILFDKFIALLQSANFRRLSLTDVEEALEAEARDALGRDYYERGAEEGAREERAPAEAPR